MSLAQSLSPSPPLSSTAEESPLLEVVSGDERAFVSLEEQVVYRLQSLWRSTVELAEKPCIEISARLEEHAYQETRKRFKMDADEVWQRDESIAHYRSLCARLLQSLQRREEKDAKRLYGKHADSEQLFRLLAREDKTTQSASASAKPVKAARSNKAKVKAEKAEKTPRATGNHKKGNSAAANNTLALATGPVSADINVNAALPTATATGTGTVAPSLSAAAAAAPVGVSVPVEAELDIEVDLGEDIDMEFDFEEG